MRANPRHVEMTCRRHVGFSGGRQPEGVSSSWEPERWEWAGGAAGGGLTPPEESDLHVAAPSGLLSKISECFRLDIIRLKSVQGEEDDVTTRLFSKKRVQG